MNDKAAKALASDRVIDITTTGRQTGQQTGQPSPLVEVTFDS